MREGLFLVEKVHLIGVVGGGGCRVRRKQTWAKDLFININVWRADAGTTIRVPGARTRYRTREKETGKDEGRSRCPVAR